MQRRKNRILGFVLLGCGVWLLYMGYSVHDESQGTWISQVLTGNLPDQALLYWTGGIILCIVGILNAKRT